MYENEKPYLKSFHVILQVPLCRQGFEEHVSSEITPSKTFSFENVTVPNEGGTVKSSTLRGKNSVTIVREPLLI